MKTLRYILAMLLSMVALWLGPIDASAKTYYWNRTHIAFGSIKVKFCDGTKKILRSDDKTKKNVCAFYFKHDYAITVWDETTGNVLLDACNIDDSYWRKITSRIDTSHTANVTIYKTLCA